MKGVTNAYDPIDISQILHGNVTLHLINKITSKWRQPTRSFHIPDKNQLSSIFSVP